MKPGRVPCVVPFCKRTCSADKGWAEFICQTHWPMVSKQTKRRRRLADKASARADMRFNQTCMRRGVSQWTSSEEARIEAARRLARALWERCKREAIERALGI